MNKISSNKSLVLNFYKNVIGQRDSEYAKKIIRDDYIQHNPMVKTGLSGVLETIEFLKQIPQPPNPPQPFIRLLEDENLVVVHMEVEVMGQKKAVMDIFRIEEGQLAEHWDAIQDIPSASANGNPMVKGDTNMIELQASGKNKKLLEKYAKEILTERQFDKIDTYLSQDLVQHHPEISNGINPLLSYYENVEYQAVHRIVGEGNFVCLQSSGWIDKADYVFYDLFRLENGEIVEHWSVSQKIPEKMAHENGMI